MVAGFAVSEGSLEVAPAMAKFVRPNPAFERTRRYALFFLGGGRGRRVDVRPHKRIVGRSRSRS